MFRSFFLVLGLCLGNCQLFAKEPVRIEVLRGAEIAPHIKEIVEFVDKIYREDPYFYDGDDLGYEEYLKSYADSKAAIICLAYEEEKVIGLSAGIPMAETRDIYKTTLSENGYDLSSLFYLGEFGLKQERQGEGIEEALYRNVEYFAHEKGFFKTICLWEVKTTLQNQSGYLPKDKFWEKMGFLPHPELTFEIFWKNTNEEKESSHTALYWINSNIDEGKESAKLLEQSSSGV